jgi:hypothetical protein
MKDESVGTKSMRHLVGKVSGKIDDFDSFEWTLLDTEVATNA